MKHLEQTMRWYGPNDAVPLSYIRQAGATGIVTALHHIDIGHIWPKEEIIKRKEIIERAGLSWSVVESVNVHESIKVADTDRDRYIDWYRTTIKNLAECGIKTICYNFMPVLDWSRTDLVYKMPDGSKALRFERIALIAFDLYILKRENAEKDYSDIDIERAKAHYDQLSDQQRKLLQANVTMGLPGSAQGWQLEEVRERVATYNDIDATQLKKNLKYFLANVVDIAEEYDVRLTIHPDDPPFPLLGLPRIVSTEDDARELVEAVPSPSNGLCLCTGSYGVRPDNDLPGMANRLAKYIHFIHLRNVKRDEDGNFFEDDHLAGDTDMYAVMKALAEEQQHRESSIPVRPDHGHAMLDDLEKITNPGYTAIGRLRGLAELRGLEHAILRSMH
ncbi:MAG: mannonate dehydratase [Saprospiraceae bacterium]|nr:mannonate dehydratase [Saprospiraceae bacterium]